MDICYSDDCHMTVVGKIFFYSKWNSLCYKHLYERWFRHIIICGCVPLEHIDKNARQAIELMKIHEP